MLHPEIAARLFDEPLAVHAGKAHAILAGIGRRVVGTEVFVVGGESLDHVSFAGGRPSAGRLSDRVGQVFDDEGMLTFDVVEGVAVIAVEGTLVHKGAFVGMYSGRTSYQGLQAQIARARSSPRIRGAVFEVDSFGGQVSGLFETARQLAALSAEKPTIAILTDFAASAAYMLASAARQIVVPERGGAGSIGAIRLHIDESKALEQEGVKVTIISSGKHKAAGNPFEPLPAALRDRLQAQLDEVRDHFAEAVAANRGTRLSKESALSTEADFYDGREAVARGLADAVGDPNDAFAEFLKALN